MHGDVSSEDVYGHVKKIGKYKVCKLRGYRKASGRVQDEDRKGTGRGWKGQEGCRKGQEGRRYNSGGSMKQRGCLA